MQIDPSTLFRVTIRGTIAVVFIGIATASVLLSIAIEHNPQAEFHNPEGIRWGNLAPLGILGFLLGCSGGFTLYFCVNLLRWWASRGKSK